MLKKVLRGLLLILAVTVLALPVFAQTGDRFRVTQSMNARSGPGIEYDVVARLGPGGIYDIIEYSPTANWVLIDLGYTQAWAFRHIGEVISLNPVTTTTTTTTTTTVVTNAGQGGGGGAPVVTVTTPLVTSTGVDLSVTMSQDEFNSTIGVLGTLRIRSAPSLSGRIITVIPYGQRATPIGRNYNGTWIQVNYEGTIGWVYFQYTAFPPAIDVTQLPVTG